MAARSISVTWPMEVEARAVLERASTVRTSHTEHELPAAELARQVADGSASRTPRLRMATRAAENCVAALEGHRSPNLVNPEAWRSA